MSDAIEAAKSSRAKCRQCGEKIVKGDLRFGEEYESEYGLSFRWYHLLCAAKKLPALLKETLEGFDGEVPNKDELLAVVAGGGTEEVLPDYPDVSVAPTGRAICIQCGEKIEKGSTRIAVEIDLEMRGRTTRGAGYLHPDCVGSWLGDNDDVDADQFNRVIVAKGGNKTQAKPTSQSDIPAFAGKSASQLRAMAKKLTKLKDEYRIGEYAEEQVDWEHRDALIWHLVRHGLLSLGKNPFVAHVLADSAEEHGDAETIEAALASVSSNLPGYEYATMLPQLPSVVFELGRRLWKAAPQRARALYPSLKPNVQAGLALAMCLDEAELPEGAPELLTTALQKLLGDYPLTIEGPEADVEVDLDQVLARLGTERQWDAEAEKFLKKCDGLPTLQGLGRALQAAPLKTLVRGIEMFDGYNNTPDSWAALTPILRQRDDLPAVAKALAKLDESTMERARLVVYPLLETLPKGAENGLRFCSISGYDGAWQPAYETILSNLGEPRARALGQRVLADDSLADFRRAWVPMLVRVYGDSCRDLLGVCVEKGIVRYLHLAPEEAFEELSAKQDGEASEALKRASVEVAMALAREGKKVPDSVDELLPAFVPALKSFAKAFSDQRMTRIVGAAMEQNPPEEVLLHLKDASQEVLRFAIGRLVQRRKKIKKTSVARSALGAIPSSELLVEEHLGQVSSDEKKFFGLLEKTYPTEVFGRLCDKAGRAVETVQQKLERLASAKGNNKGTLLFFETNNELEGFLVETMSYVGDEPPPGVEAPKGQEQDKKHVLTLDLSPFADLVERYGAETLSLFVESPSSGAFNDEAQLVNSPKLKRLPTGATRLRVGAVQLPEELLQTGKSAEAKELRSILYRLDGHAFGPAYWIQQSLGPSVTLQINDAYLNLGDAGSLYIGDFGATWQSH